jgi:hypothetical protein
MSLTSYDRRPLRRGSDGKAGDHHRRRRPQARCRRTHRRQYAAAHRIIKATSGAEALEALGGSRGDTGLIVADQRMPQMTGTGSSSPPHRPIRRPAPCCSPPMPTPTPPSRRSTTSGRPLLDSRIRRRALYPVLDDLLEDWRRNVDAPTTDPGPRHHLVAAHSRHQGLPAARSIPIPRHRARRRGAGNREFGRRVDSRWCCSPTGPP